MGFLPRACLQVWFVCRIPCVSDGKEPAGNSGDGGSIPGYGRSPGEGNGNSFQYYCLDNPMNRGDSGPQSMGSQKDKTEELTLSFFISKVTLGPQLMQLTI